MRASGRAGVFHLAQVVVVVLIAISIACSTSKSASPPSQLASSQPVSSPATPLPSSAAPEQSACKLTLSEAPAINRVKLGMTVDEILVRFPGSKEDADVSAQLARRGQFGNGSLLITPSKYGSSADFKDVNRLSFSLLDGRVSSLTINYNGPEWPDVDKFVEKFLEGRDLPGSAQWEPYAGLETQMKTLTCAGFSIQVFIGGQGGSQNYVLLKDIDADKKLKDRRKKAQQPASPTP